jgi:hypothetical protein
VLRQFDDFVKMSDPKYVIYFNELPTLDKVLMYVKSDSDLQLLKGTIFYRSSQDTWVEF